MNIQKQKWQGPLLVILSLFIAFALVACGTTQEAADTEESTSQSEESASGSEDSGAGDSIEIADEPVARVNGVPIFQSELERFVEDNQRRMAQQGQQVSEDQLVMLRERVLGGLINREVLLQEATQLGLDPEETAIESQMGNIRSQFDSDEAFQAALEQQGLTEAELRDNISIQLAIDALVEQEVFGQIEVTEEEMRSFYEENQQLFQQPESVEASHILIQTQGLSEDEKVDALNRAEEIREEVVDGADFNEVAQERSEGPSASNGGRLGSFQRGQMVPAFEEAAFNMEPGEISEVVETQFGYHIILVTDKSEGDSQSFADAQPRIRQYLEQQENNEALESYVNRLRADAEVEILYDEVEEPATDSETDSEEEE